MKSDPSTTPSWLPDLFGQVEQGLRDMTAGKHDQRPALENELKDIEESIQGWSTSLANPKLGSAVRETIESKWQAAIERQQGIQAELSSMQNEATCAEDLVRPEQVHNRLNRLADVLAADNPTRGNLELSLHIDRIVCFRDRKVTLRLCKLGVMPDAVMMFSAPSIRTKGDSIGHDKPSRSRRRGKLRVIDEGTDVDLRAQANFIANSERFAGLSDEWFWTDEFRIPESISWAAENATAVFRRRQETRFSFRKLADEFKVTPPTVRAAIRHFLTEHPDEREEVCLRRGGQRPRKFDLAQFSGEARQLWTEGWSKEKLARKYGCSAPTVSKAIALAYSPENLSMPTTAEARSHKANEARRLLDAGTPLEDIAATMKVSDVTVRKYLRQSFTAEGKVMPDLRRRNVS